jgi:hypothetical protein
MCGTIGPIVAFTGSLPQTYSTSGKGWEISEVHRVSCWPRDSGQCAFGGQPVTVGGSSMDVVIVQYRAAGWRRWYPAVSAVAWLLVGTSLFMRHHQWWGLAFAAVWAALTVTVMVLPRIVISDQGVRFVGRKIILWSQVVDIVARPSQPWPKRTPEMVLRDGRRKSLAELNDLQIEGLRSLAFEHGSPISS